MTASRFMENVKSQRRRRRLTTIRDSRKTAVGEHLYVKWGTLRTTVVERGRRRRAWTRERREFYRAHCLVFPTAAVDFSAHTAAATGRLPRPSTAPLIPLRHPFPIRPIPSQLDVRGGSYIDCLAPKRTT